jgi:hypothetical protein
MEEMPDLNDFTTWHPGAWGDLTMTAIIPTSPPTGMEEMPDLNDFTTWHPGAWGDLGFDKSPIPADPYTSICSVRPYLAQAMIMWYDTAVRERNAQAWDRLNSVWKATFHTALTAGALETWPTDGPHSFSEPQSTWLRATLRYLKGNGRAPSRAQPPGRRPRRLLQPPNLLHTSTTAGRGGGASRTARNPDHVVQRQTYLEQGLHTVHTHHPWQELAH